jgi:hypothetical protein
VNPVEYARGVVVAAFDQNQKDQKGRMRSINRVLSLAKTRGYDNADQFIAHFKNNENHYKPSSNRLLKNLFEYVSAEEFVSLVRVELRKML